jgi:hypothetical protein
MKYLCIVYVDEAKFDTMSESEQATLDEASLATSSGEGAT